MGRGRKVSLLGKPVVDIENQAMKKECKEWFGADQMSTEAHASCCVACASHRIKFL